MSEQRPSLKDFFDKTRNEQPAVPAEEIKALIEQQPVIPQTAHNPFTQFAKKGLTMKLTLAAATMLSAGATLFYLYGRPAGSNNFPVVSGHSDEYTRQIINNPHITKVYGPSIELIPTLNTAGEYVFNKTQSKKWIHYQCKITDANGTPLSGIYSFTYAIYADSSSHNALWTETKEVPGKDGSFHLTIGINDSLTIDFDGTYWLGLSINNGKEVPRIKITKDDEDGKYVEINARGPEPMTTGTVQGILPQNSDGLFSLVSVHGLKCIQLSTSELANLGIWCGKDCSANYYELEGDRTFSYTLSQRGTNTGATTKDPAVKKPKFCPSLITDDIGNKRLTEFTNAEIESGDNQIDINRLVPILVKPGCTYSREDSIANRWRPDFIFWYKPTPEFLAALPKRFHKEMVKELVETDSLIQKIQTMALAPVSSGVAPAIEKPDTIAIAAKQNAPTDEGSIASQNISSPQYFEMLRNVSGAITASWIYPNPTRGECTIEYTLAQPRMVTFTLHNISGQELRTLGHQSSAAGISKFNVQVQGIAPGIYLVALTTDKGEQAIQRLIVIN
jgi:hypothetical protein